jgi:hypothetical protein
MGRSAPFVGENTQCPRFANWIIRNQSNNDEIKPPVRTAICIAALILGVPSGAPAKEKKTETANPEASASRGAQAKLSPYRGRVGSVDASAKTFTVGKRTIKVTDQTKITKEGADATVVDIIAGERVSGSYWKKDDGSLEAKNVKVGAKAEVAAPITNARPRESGATAASPSP